MKLYAVKNDKGEYWDFEINYWSSPDLASGSFVDSDLPLATNTASNKGGHMVELIEKPEPVEVSEDEAKLVEQSKSCRYPAMQLVSAYSEAEDRLMRAYVNGYTVKPEPRWYVRVQGDFERPTYYTVLGGKLKFGYKDADRCKTSDFKVYPFTLSELKRYGLQDLPREEVGRDAD